MVLKSNLYLILFNIYIYFVKYLLLEYFSKIFKNKKLIEFFYFVINLKKYDKQIKYFQSWLNFIV